MRPLVRLLALALLAPPALAGGEKILHWRGQAWATDALPAVGDAPRGAIEVWAEFARARGYRMDLEDDGRVLVIGRGDSAAERHMELVRRVLELFERELPPPPPPPAEGLIAGAGAEGGKAAESRAADVLPEDPEGPPPRWKPPVTVRVIPDYEWGRGTIQPDTETATILVLRDMEHYAAALDLLAGREPYLAPWVEEARKQVGFVLEQPLCGAYVLNASGQEEWNPDNELVHRAASLLLLRRFGQQPWWLLLGWSWHAEIEILGGVYCFPYRDEFVWASEHAGWDREVRREVKDDPKRALAFERAAGWRRGTWKADAAHASWALVDGILRLEPGKLPAALDELRRFRDAHDRKQTSDTTWERIRGYEIPVGDQRRILFGHVGADFVERLTKDYQRKR